MLVVGGVGSVSGAVVGVLFLTLVTEILRHLEAGVTVSSLRLQLPYGFQEVCLGIIMIIILICRPAGLMNGRELSWPFPRVKSGKRRGLPELDFASRAESQLPARHDLQR
jgi:branched-chain amino acid transport system permease protein